MVQETLKSLTCQMRYRLMSKRERYGILWSKSKANWNIYN